MIRCPRCGGRVSPALPVCSVHGAVSPAADSGRSNPPSDPALAPERNFEACGYRVTALLGRGGFGAVYAAERASDRLAVAIKLALRGRRDAEESLEREHSALRAVGAPHVPAVYDSGSIAEGDFLVMERIEAPTLADRLLELAGPAPLHVFEPLAHAILTPVEAIHAAGFVHRDLKPENILVHGTGVARVIDFGLARPQGTGSAPQNIEETLEGDAGTAEYMSPEQCDGMPDADYRSDVYSLGVLFYELLTGAPPFWGRAAEVREAHRSRRPAPLSLRIECSPELDQVVRRCLAKDRGRRFQSVPELRRALAKALSANLTSKQPPAPTRPPASEANVPSSPPTAAREKRAMGLVFFESRGGLGGVQPVVTAAGGQIVQTNGAQYVAAFGHDVGDNPARAALIAASRLLAAKLADRLVVDVATVSVQQRPDGSRRIFSAVLTKRERFPTAADPRGVMLATAAHEVLSELESQPHPTRPDRVVLTLQEGTTELTTVGVQAMPLIGRAGVLAMLLETAARAATEARPTLVTVLGAHGYGRTHLAAVAGVEIERSNVAPEVIRLAAQEGMVSATSQVLPDLLRRVLDLPVQVPALGAKELLLEKLGDLAGGVWAGAAHALGWIDAEHPDVRRLAAAPGALRLASARAAGEALRRRAGRRPLALLLDDAHLADEATLDALEYATRKEVASPLWICVLARPTFAASRPAWGSRAGFTQRIVLTELAPRDAIELARRLLLPAEYIPEKVLLRLVERTQGVPRLLVELVRGLKRDGLVRRAERGTGHYLAIDELDKLPDLPIVQWNAIREIEALPAQLAGHARLSSVLRSSFSVPELEAMLHVLERDGLPEDLQLDASVGAQRLIDSGLLVRHRSGRLDFRHALLRETIDRMVPEAQRARFHRAAFEAYRGSSLPASQRLPRLALHAALSGEREIAAEAYLEIAERAARVQSYLEAEAAYGSALENLADDDERAIDAARGRALMRSRLARHESALLDLRRARERASARGASERVIELMLDEATVLDWTREASQSAALVSEIEAMNADLSPLLRARLAMAVARVHHRRGEAESTVRVGSEAVRLAEALGDEGYETRIIAELMVATDCTNVGRLEEAEHSFDQVIAEAQSRGDLWHVAAALGNRSLLWHGKKDLDRLFSDLLKSAQLGREIGEASIEFLATYNLAESEYVLSHFASAREHARRARELSMQLFGETNREVSVCELLLARVALYDGDDAEARELAAKIRARAAEAGAAGEQEAELEPNLQLSLEMIELAVNEVGIEAWRSLVERARVTEMQPMEEVELLERAALAAESLGEREIGREFYQEALAVSVRKPNLLSTRVERRLSAMFDG